MEGVKQDACLFPLTRTKIQDEDFKTRIPGCMRLRRNPSQDTAHVARRERGTAHYHIHHQATPESSLDPLSQHELVNQEDTALPCAHYRIS